MAQDQLLQLFQEKKQKARPSGVDWDAKREAWIKAVIELYRTIEDDYLKAAKADVEMARRTKDVREFLVGAYQVPELILRVGDEEVVFSPQGANVAVAQGRIDVEGECGRQRSYGKGKTAGASSCLGHPLLRLVELTADSLANILRAVMRP